MSDGGLDVNFFQEQISDTHSHPERSLGKTQTKTCLELPRTQEDRLADESTTDFVCEVCSCVDWPLVANLRAVSRRQKNPWCVVIPSLDATWAKLSASPCKVCRSLAAIKPPTYDSHQCVLCAYIGTYGYTQLRVVPQQPYGMETLYLHKQLVQETFPSITVIGPNDDQDLRGIILQPSRISSECYDDLKDILSNCVQSHGQTCRPISECLGINGLKLIEVSSGTVIEAPGKCEYLALSYVWGHHQHSNDPRAAPAVIKDTFQVAERLGVKYCIPKEEGQEKQEMLGRMGEIYSNAYCTIIAAAGQDAQTGLPGVSKICRREQRTVSLKGVTLFERPYSEDHGSALLSSSKWATRAWTYQEGYLSTRRLIFTDYCLLYLCNREFTAEPFQHRVETTVKANKQSFARFVPNVAFNGHRVSTATLRGNIQEYTRRDLSRPEDSINAFLGVLDFISKTRRPVAHLWGLPLYEDQAMAPQPRDIIFELFWWHESPGTRRRGFPSWTWAGWAGPVRFRTTDRVRMFPEGASEGLRLPPPDHPRGMRIKVIDDGDMTLYEYAKATLQNTGSHGLHSPHLGPKRLSVHCHALPLQLQCFELSEEQINKEYVMRTKKSSEYAISEWSRKPHHSAGGQLAVVQVCIGIYMCIYPRLDLEVEPQMVCFALHFGTVENKSSGLFVRDRSLLVVRRICDETYERIGLIHWRFIDLDQAIFFIDDEASFAARVSLPPEDELFSTVAEAKTICLV